MQGFIFQINGRWPVCVQQDRYLLFDCKLKHQWRPDNEGRYFHGIRRMLAVLLRNWRAPCPETFRSRSNISRVLRLKVWLSYVPFETVDLLRVPSRYH